MMKAIFLSGPFSTIDLEVFASVMRLMERLQPDQRFKMAIKDLEREPTIEEMADELDRLFPKLPNQEPVKTFIRRKRD